jgi:tRNA pseudouridine-54 N-methylase
MVIHMAYDGEEVISRADTGEKISTTPFTHMRPLLIEVKTGSREVGELLRQVNAYRKFIDDFKNDGGSDISDLQDYAFVLAVCFPLSEGEVEVLTKSRVHTIRLGPKFQQYVREQRAMEAGRLSGCSRDPLVLEV